MKYVIRFIVAFCVAVWIVFAAVISLVWNFNSKSVKNIDFSFSYGLYRYKSPFYWAVDKPMRKINKPRRKAVNDTNIELLYVSMFPFF